MHKFHRLFIVFWLAFFLAGSALAAPPIISSFTVTMPNGEENTSLTIKQGEQINFRWQLSGDLATQLVISPSIGDIGDVLGRSSKIVAAAGTGQFTYTLTATNTDGSASRQVIINVLPPAPPAGAETLYNGIALPSVWPPQPGDYPTALQPPAYLANPPATIPINVGRQLLVDDFLIESTTLAREFYPAQMHPGNPVLSPVTTVENSGLGPMAMPFSNGVFYDPAESLFKLWYMCGYRQSLCYATSTDGINWNRPSLDVVAGTNIVLTDTRLMDGYTTWIDLAETIPARRYKLLRVVFNGSLDEFHLHYSADGIHWGQPVAINKSLNGDRSTFFYNPFRRKWVLSLRAAESGTRVRRYFEHKDLSFALNLIVTSNPSSVEKLFTDTSKWLKSDSADTAHAAALGFTPQLYDVDAAPYESLILGQMTILRGNVDKPLGRPKLNEVYFGFSRDGFNWQRPNRQAMFSVNNTSGSWNWGNVQPSAGGPIVVGDQLYFYFSGRGGVPKGGYNDGGGATGLATMRRDGFAAMYAGDTEGTLTTRPVTFNGKYLFVNADIAAGGSLCAEVLDQNNQVIAPFSKANCQSFSGNSTKQIISWTGISDLAPLINTPVKIRFYLNNGKLYSFWVSPASSGISRGFVGAGGPEFGKYVDDGTPPPTSASLTPATQTVTAGQSVTLNYRTTNADNATLTPAIANCTIIINSNASCSFTAMTGSATTYTLTATRGNQTATVTASVTVNTPDTQPPTVTIAQLAATSTEQATITLTGTAQDDTAVTQVNFSSDLGAQGQASGLANWTANVALQLGPNIITVEARDAAGNAGTARVTITRTQPSANANRAASFDGRTGYVSIPAGDVGVYTKFWSLEAWVNSTSQSAEFQSVLGNRDGNELLLTRGKVFVINYSSGFTVFYGTHTVNDGAWHHLVAVRNNDKLYLYIDGQADEDSETHQPFKSLRSTADNNFDLRAVGNRGTPAQWYSGQVDDVRVYSRALTLAEVQAHYNNGAGIPAGPDTGLRMGYSFDEESGAALDFSGNNKHGTLAGGVTRVLKTGGSSPPSSTPQITGFTVAASGQTPAASATITFGQGVTLAWQTANVQTAAISGTQCSVTPLASGFCQHTPTQIGQFSFTLTAQGSSATASASVSVTVNTPPPPVDTQPPSVSINSTPAATTEQTSITLTGAAQDNVGVTGLIYQTDRGQQGQPSGVNPWSATVPLAIGGNIVIVRAQDAAGNFGSTQITITRTEPPPPDMPPPPGANAAMQFDGFTGNVAVPTGDNGVQTRFWTIELWVKTSTQRVDFMTLVGNRSGNDLRMAGGQMILSTYSSGFTHFVSRRRINDNQWHHVVALRNSDRLLMYIDGQIEYAQSDGAQQGFVNINSPATASNFNLKSLGNRGTADEWYTGLMDDVRLYTRALSVSEIQAHYNNGQGIPSAPDTGLFVGYDFNEASGNALDFSGNSRHGQLKGAATRGPHN